MAKILSKRLDKNSTNQADCGRGRNDRFEEAQQFRKHSNILRLNH